MAVDHHTAPASPSRSTEDGPDQSILIVAVRSSSGLEDLEVVAYSTPTPGLMVHRSPWDTTGWTITHAATGTAVSRWSWPSQEAATALAQRLEPLADWTADEDQLCASLDKDIHGSAGRIRQTAEALAAELGLTLPRGWVSGPEASVSLVGAEIAP